MCDCGCGGCSPQKPVMLNESLAPKEILSEGLKYHMDNNMPLTEHVYRAGSQKYFELWAEARALYTRGILEVTDNDLEVLTETDLGHFGMFEGKKVPLDFPMLEEEVAEWPKKLNSRYNGEYRFELQKVEPTYKNKPGRAKYHVIDIASGELKGTPVFGSVSSLQTFADNLIKPQGGTQSTNLGELLNEQMDIYDDIANSEFGMDYDQLGSNEKEWVRDEIDNMSMNEAKKNNKKLNKPMRDSSGGKAYKVYVKDPKTKKIKTVRFGSGGLRAKINDKEARNAFAARHKCSTKKDKTKAGYWSCRLPRYAKLLGLKSNFGGFW